MSSTEQDHAADATPVYFSMDNWCKGNMMGDACQYNLTSKAISQIRCYFTASSVARKITPSRSRGKKKTYRGPRTGGILNEFICEEGYRGFTDFSVSVHLHYKPPPFTCHPPTRCQDMQQMLASNVCTTENWSRPRSCFDQSETTSPFQITTCANIWKAKDTTHDTYRTCFFCELSVRCSTMV